MRFMGCQITIHRAHVDPAGAGRRPPAGKITWVDVLDETGLYRAAFRVEDGRLVETVEFGADHWDDEELYPPVPYWDEAGEVNPDLAADPPLCRMLAELFREDGQL